MIINYIDNNGSNKYDNVDNNNVNNDDDSNNNKH